MKKFGFLISAICMTLASLTSCFSSGGKMNESSITYDGYHATKLNLNGITIVQAICEVGGLLKGYAEVDQATSQDLYAHNVDGLLVFLREYEDKKLTQLKDPDFLVDKSFSYPTEAGVVEAFCYPHNVKFKNPIKLTVETDEAEGMDLIFSFQGKETDFSEVTTDSKGVYSEIRHFSYWLFKMKFTVNYLETQYIESNKFKSECRVVDKDNYQVSEYSADYGFKTDTKNPFVYYFLKQWVKFKNSEKFSFRWLCTEKPGTQYYHYVQPLYKMSLTSGTHTYYFDVYGKPVAHKDEFTPFDHNGGAGVNP